MRKHSTRQRMTVTEWQELPLTFDSAAMARACGCCKRYVQDHAHDLGGRMVAGRWLFSKPRTAELLGLGL